MVKQKNREKQIYECSKKNRHYEYVRYTSNPSFQLKETEVKILAKELKL